MKMDRWFLGLVALLDLSLACMRSEDEVYRDQDSEFKLQLNSRYCLQDTTADKLGIVERESAKPFPKGTTVSDLGIPVRDPIGHLLDESKSFADVVTRVAYFALLSLDYVRQKPYMHDDVTTLRGLIYGTFKDRAVLF
jgi:hypothetical protein